MWNKKGLGGFLQTSGDIIVILLCVFSALLFQSGKLLQISVCGNMKLRNRWTEGENITCLPYSNKTHSFAAISHIAMLMWSSSGESPTVCIFPVFGWNPELLEILAVLSASCLSISKTFSLIFV